jgi:NAD(P)-dependent dehydrogenase (short-subunit alcohol dehydrogenase family)
VNNAATGVPGPATKAPRAAVERTFAVNVYGPLSVIQHVVPVMPRGGRIVNIGSVGSKLGTPQSPIYAASKATMDALAFAMAQEVCFQCFVTFTFHVCPVADISRCRHSLVVNTVSPSTR